MKLITRIGELLGMPLKKLSEGGTTDRDLMILIEEIRLIELLHVGTDYPSAVSTVTEVLRARARELIALAEEIEQKHMGIMSSGARENA